MSEVCCPACGSRLSLDVISMTVPGPEDQLTLDQGRPRVVPEPAPIPVRVDVIERSTVAALGSGELARAAVLDYCVANGVSLSLLTGRSRSAMAVLHRQAAMAAARMAGASLPAIGRVLGRDHTTVLHGVRAHERRAA